MPTIDIKPSDFETVRAILAKHLANRQVLAFGSRVIGTAKPFSDLDLAVLSDQPVPSDVLGNLKDDFDESTLPFKVDIIDWATTGESFRKIIQRDGVALEDLAVRT